MAITWKLQQALPVEAYFEISSCFRLYQIAAIETDGEVIGLWSRPIRASALQHLLTTVREATPDLQEGQKNIEEISQDFVF